MAEQSDPFHKYQRKLNDVKKRDFLVKRLKKEREELHYQRQQRLQEEIDEEPVAHVAPKAAQAIVIVKDSYLSRNLSNWNNTQNKDSLPRKWSKKQQELEDAEDDDEDDEDDGDEDDLDDEDDDGEEEDDDDNDLPTINNHKANTKQVAQQRRNSKQYPTHEESSDDDEDELRFTQKRVVQFIEAFNEVEIIDNELDPNPLTEQQHDYNHAKTVAPRSMRDKSKSPRLGAQSTPKQGASTPKQGGLTPKQRTAAGDDNDDLDSLSLSKNNNVKLYNQQHGGQKNNAADKQQNLIQQMKDLDLESLLEKKTVNQLQPLPHDEELDTGVWWKYILDHGATIRKDGMFVINVVDHFRPARDHDIPEDYFHIPAHRKSAPEKPLTPFGLFKQHKLAEDPSLIVKSTHKKKNQPKHHSPDAQLKTMYYALSDEEMLDYHVLALCEKIRYKCQRAEFIYWQSTHISHQSTKKDRHGGH